MEKDHSTRTVYRGHQGLGEFRVSLTTVGGVDTKVDSLNVGVRDVYTSYDVNDFS